MRAQVELKVTSHEVLERTNTNHIYGLNNQTCRLIIVGIDKFKRNDHNRLECQFFAWPAQKDKLVCQLVGLSTTER